MDQEIEIRKINTTDKGFIDQAAIWYLQEWSIPIERTIQRLSTQTKDDVLFQLAFYKNGKPIATGGLYNNVGLLHEHEKFKKLGPWIALLYTEPNSRNQKCGQTLLQEIEKNSKNLGYKEIYLYTFTAESLYLRNGWKPLEQVIYKGNDTVVMKKEI